MSAVEVRSWSEEGGKRKKHVLHESALYRAAWCVVKRYCGLDHDGRYTSLAGSSELVYCLENPMNVGIR